MILCSLISCIQAAAYFHPKYKDDPTADLRELIGKCIVINPFLTEDPPPDQTEAVQEKKVRQLKFKKHPNGNRNKCRHCKKRCVPGTEPPIQHYHGE